MVQWNGISLLTALEEVSPSVVLTSDASGAWGCGAYWVQDGSSSPGLVHLVPHSHKGIPVVMAEALWGRFWSWQIVNCRCDNEVVVSVLNSRSSKDSNLMC